MNTCTLPPASETALSQQQAKDTKAANKSLNVNAAETNHLIYNQIIILSINASAVISLPETPGHFSSSKLAAQGEGLQ